MCITNCKFNCIYRKLFYFIVNYFGCGLNFFYNYYSEAVFYAFWVIFSRCVLRELLSKMSTSSKNIQYYGVLFGE